MMADLRLSPHFLLSEFTRSDAARELGDANAPGQAHLANLKRLALGLEEVRLIVGGRPLVITSGYRNRRVNRYVGGVVNSAHAMGFAADFHVPGLGLRSVARMLQMAGRDGDLRFDQVIWEKGRGVIHISFDPRSRGQVLTQAGGPGSPAAVGIVG